MYSHNGWCTKFNETTSTRFNFTYKKTVPLPVSISGHIVLYENTAKYLGMTLDAKLKRKVHLKKKELNIKCSKLYWLLGRYSELSVENEVMIYKQILKLAWMYGI